MDTNAMDGEGLTSLQSFWIRHIRQCEVSANGGVKDHALEHGLEPQDLYRWRSWFRKGGVDQGEEKTIEIPAHTRRGVGRRPLPADLPREEIIHDLCCGRQSVCPGWTFPG